MENAGVRPPVGLILVHYEFSFLKQLLAAFAQVMGKKRLSQDSWGNFFSRSLALFSGADCAGAGLDESIVMWITV